MLSAGEIRQAIEKALADDDDGLFISPTPDLELLTRRGATSVDLRLDRWFLSFKQTRTSSVSLIDDSRRRLVSRTRQHFVPFDEDSYYVLHPGSFVLGATLEWLGLPDGISGYVTGKSRLGRHASS
jgi:dCTP deaminase